MKELKPTPLIAGKPEYRVGENVVFYACAKGDLVLWGFSKTSQESAALLLNSSEARALEKSVGGFIALFRESDRSKIEIKLVGETGQLRAVKEIFQKSSHKIASEVETGEFEVFLYSDSGRVRLSNLSPATPQTSVQRKVRALVVDDSKTIRQLLRQVLESDPWIEVVGEADRPSQAEPLLASLKPDVVTLDIHMPEMDGVAFLEKYLPRYPIPTVMVSSISMQEGDEVLRALNTGAVDYIQKPSLNEISTVAPIIIEKVKVAANVRVTREKSTALGSIRDKSRAHLKGISDLNRIVVIGSSTGGVQALEYLLTRLPEEIPPIVIVQHIPPAFSMAFAKRLNGQCSFEVKEAEDGDEVKPGRVLIAPGGLQMELQAKTGRLQVRIFDGPPVNRHKPSVDVLFDSAASLLGKRCVGVILTGMGADGARGLLKMRKAGARTIAQDEASCVVFGMPKEAIQLGAAEQICPLSEIPEQILRLIQKRKAA